MSCQPIDTFLKSSAVNRTPMTSPALSNRAGRALAGARLLSWPTLAVIPELASAFVFLAVVAFGATGEAGSIPPSTYLLNGRALMETRRRALAGDPGLDDSIKELCRRADRHTRGELWTVTSKPFAAPSGNRHDYVSLASYFWPDADSPTGLPYISRDGQVNPESHRYDRHRLDGMCEAVHTLALAHYLSARQ